MQCLIAASSTLGYVHVRISRLARVAFQKAGRCLLGKRVERQFGPDGGKIDHTALVRMSGDDDLVGSSRPFPVGKSRAGAREGWDSSCVQAGKCLGPKPFNLAAGSLPIDPPAR